MKSFFLCLVALLSNSLLIQAAEPGNLDAVARYVGPSTVAVGRAELEHVDVSQVAAAYRSVMNISAERLADREQKMKAFVEKIRQHGATDVYFTAEIQPAFRWIIAIREDGDQRLIREAVQEFTASEPYLQTTIDGSLLVISKQKQLLEPSPQPSSGAELKAALTVNDTPLEIALLLSPDIKRVFQEFVPSFGENPAAAMEGFRYGAIGITPDRGKSQLAVTLQSKDAASATAAKSFVDAIVDKALSSDPSIRRDELRKALATNVEGDRVILSLKEEGLSESARKQLTAFLVAPGGQNQRTMTDLKQLGLAIHNYHDVHGKLPPQGNKGPEGKLLLSWRVHILPYLDQKALYDQFHLDEPWDSEHNKKLIDKMPAIYDSPFVPLGVGKTLFQAPGGKGMLFSVEPISFRQIKDGLSTTVMVINCPTSKPVFWTKPEDLNLDAQHPLKALGGEAPLIYTTFGDGSARILPPREDLIKRVLTYDGGEVVNWD